MRDPKPVLGLKVPGVQHRMRGNNYRDLVPHPVVYEILEAHQGRVRCRMSFVETGEVWETLQGDDHNPRIKYDGYAEIYAERGEVYEGHWQVRTWRNGDELPTEKAQGYNYCNDCLCAVLSNVYGDDRFTGYEHNYLFRDGTAWEIEENDPEE